MTDQQTEINNALKPLLRGYRSNRYLDAVRPNLHLKQKWFLQMDDLEVMYGGAAGGGKILYDNSLILTPTGFIKGKNINVGDTINNPDGTTCKISAISPRGTHHIWRVSFHDGAFTDVAEKHLWKIWISGIPSKTKVVETIELQKLYQKAKDNQDTNKRPAWPLIPISSPQEFIYPKKDKCSLDPYLLGYWLGDGHNTLEDGVLQQVGITSADIEHTKKMLIENNMEWKEYIKPNNRAITFYFIKQHKIFWKKNLYVCGLLGRRSWDKFIPDEYKLGTIVKRTAILQGLLDTDGTIDSRGQVYFCSCSKQLSDDVKFIVQSLGGTATVFEKKTKCRMSYSVYIKLPKNIKPFRLSRKLSRVGKDDLLYRRVTGVEKLEEKNTGRCITVSNPNGLYITNDFIVTHNSDALLMAALQYVDIPGYAAILFRNSFTDLNLPSAIMHRCAEWLANIPGARKSDGGKKWDFDGGGTLQFGYMESEADRYRYKSSEFQFCGFDESSSIPFECYKYLFSRMRKPAYNPALPIDHPKNLLSKVPLRMRSACVDQGDVLTVDGWKPIETIKAGEEVYSVSRLGVMKKSIVKNVFRYNHNDKLVRINKKNLFMSMTLDHRVLYKQSEKSNNYTLAPWSSYTNKSITIVRSPEKYANESSYKSPINSIDTDLYLQFIGLFISDGCTVKPNRGNYHVIITGNDPKKNKTLKEMFPKLPWNFYECSNGDFVICNKVLWEHLRPLGKSHQKYIPQGILRTASNKQLEILFKWLCHGDGSERNLSNTYVTTSSKLCDNICELGVKLGYKVQYDYKPSNNPNHNDRYTVYLTLDKGKQLPLTKVDKDPNGRNDTEIVDYKGYVYCLQIPGDETFIIRQQGKVWVSGNTNPNGPYVEDIKNYFVPKKYLKSDEETQFSKVWATVGECGVCDGKKKIEIDNEYIACTACNGEGTSKRFFVPARLKDNPSIDYVQYKINLSKLPPEERAAQEHGRWDLVSDGKLFKSSWIRRFCFQGDHIILKKFDGPGGHKLIDSEKWFTFITADTAQKIKTVSDYTCIVVWACCLPNYEICRLQIVRQKMLVPHILPKIKEMYDRWNCRFVYIEEQSSGIALIQEGQMTDRGSGLNILPYVTGTVDKVTRSTNSRILMEGSGIFFRDSDDTIEIDCTNELLSFPDGVHDDYVDCQTMAADYVMRESRHQRNMSGSTPGTQARQGLVFPRYNRY